MKKGRIAARVAAAAIALAMLSQNAATVYAAPDSDATETVIAEAVPEQNGGDEPEVSDAVKGYLSAVSDLEKAANAATEDLEDAVDEDGNISEENRKAIEETIASLNDLVDKAQTAYDELSDDEKALENVQEAAAAVTSAQDSAQYLQELLDRAEDDEEQDENAQENENKASAKEKSDKDTTLLADVNEALTAPKVEMNGKVYDSIAEAVDAFHGKWWEYANIYLGTGTYTLYGETLSATDKRLNLFGAGTDKTTWEIGGVDTSLASADYVKFTDMTFVSGSGDRGFDTSADISVDNCVIEGRVSYWGRYAYFSDTIFNAPTGDYAIDLDHVRSLTFYECTFNTDGKAIHAYDADANFEYGGIRIEGCTFVNSSSTAGCQVVDIDDSNDVGYDIYFEGEITLKGEYPIDTITCSRLFGFGSDAGRNGGNTNVSFEYQTAFQNGQIQFHEVKVYYNSSSYDNGQGGDNKIWYSEGYRDDAYNYTTGDWEVKDGHKARSHTKVCQYCGYTETTWEYGLDTDLLVDGNTETEKVYVVSRGQELKITGTMELDLVEDQIQQSWTEFQDKEGLEDWEKNEYYLSDVDYTFSATLEVPKDLTLPAGLQASDLDVKGLDKELTYTYWDYDTDEKVTKQIQAFEIRDVVQNGNQVTITIGLTEDASHYCYWFADLENCFDDLGDEEGQVQITIPGVRVNNDAPANTYLTMVGTVSGSFRADVIRMAYPVSVEDTPSGGCQISYAWAGFQWPDGRDAIATDENRIQLTVIIPEDTPETPQEPNDPGTPHDTTSTPVYQEKGQVDVPQAAEPETVEEMGTITEAETIEESGAISTTGDDSLMMVYGTAAALAMLTLAAWALRRRNSLFR